MGVERIRERLTQARTFWAALDRALAATGFDPDYIERLPTLSPGGRPKYVKDTVWGMMEFEPDELAIIDSPLLQRLRRIAQLGLTFLTYPSAEHSRFAHTLGVAHVVKRLVLSVRAAQQREPVLRAGGTEYPLYDPVGDGHLARSLAHAALLHDVGHLAFSHAGENAFASNADTLVGGIELDEFLGFFEEEGFESSLSECLSIAICLSPRFAAFYGKVVGTADLDRRLHEICSFIGGVPHHPSYPGLANLISGAAVDADKIDYLNRDARQCGIPVGVDVSRVFLNSMLVRVDEAQALTLSRSRGGARDSGRFAAGVHFIVNSSGIDTYDEIANAKSVLYQRVYLHQLTRNAEQVLAEALDAAMRSPPPSGALGDPHDVLSWFELGDDGALARLSREQASRPVAMRLLTRDLPKRAFTIFRDACEPFVALGDVFDAKDRGGRDGPRILNDLDVDYHRRTAWRLFGKLVPVDAVERQRKLADLRARIRREAVEVRRQLDRDFDPTRLRGDEPYVGVSPRFELKPINEVLVREKNSIGHSGQWTKSEELSNADSVGRGVDYVHADRAWRPYVAVACAKVLYELHADDPPSTLTDLPALDTDGAKAGIALRPRLILRLQDVCARTGLNYADLLRDMTAAARRGYFGRAERVVPLADEQLLACRSVAERYALFRGEGGWQVTEGSVAAFVRQFPVDLRGEMLAVLNRGTVIDRGAVREAVDRMTRRLTADGVGSVVFARFSPNSGTQTGITLEQERKAQYEAAGHEFVRSLSELEERLARGPASCVVFVDDQFATGGQAHAQLLHWSGKPQAEWPAEIRAERNIDFSRPGERTSEHLKHRMVRLMFLHGTAAGQARVAEVARAEGFADLLALYDQEIPASGPNLSQELTSFLAETGYGLLRELRHAGLPDLDGAQEASLRGDALGYGNVGTVMVTTTSAPSHALTALWCPGIIQGQAWIPLFLRRGYRRNLVLG